MNKDDDKPRVRMAQLVAGMREDILAHIEYESLRAKLTRAKYLALIKEGFTETQAMELCWR